MPLKITVLGLNKLGASLGLALGTLDQEALPSGRPTITGWDRDRRTLSDARGQLAIDREARDIADAVREADIVFVSVPLAELGDTFDAIAPHMRHGAVVVDVDPNKQRALDLARMHLPTTVEFIGSHPVLDQPDGTVRDSSLDLFRQAIFCLVPGPRARPDAVELLAVLVRAIGAKPYYIDAAEHDAYVAGAQQLPMIVSVGLMETLRRSGGWREMQALAGGSLAAMAQPLADDPTASRASCAGNSDALRERLNELIRVLVELRDGLDQPDELQEIFESTHEMQVEWAESQPHMRPGEQEFFNQPQPENTYGISGLFFGRRRPRSDRRKR
jgi:prephenate dehydrogenase